MKTVALDQLKSGMVTAKPVTDAMGNLLVREGTVLKDEVIARLRARRVTVVSIEDASGAADAAGIAGVGPAADWGEDTAEREVAHMFERVRGDEVMGRLEVAAKAHLKGMIAQRKGASAAGN
ncbi:MAG: hypothetical protein V1809_13415 [Planctomycetota bacterium]